VWRTAVGSQPRSLCLSILAQSAQTLAVGWGTDRGPKEETTPAVCAREPLLRTNVWRGGRQKLGVERMAEPDLARWRCPCARKEWGEAWPGQSWWDNHYLEQYMDLFMFQTGCSVDTRRDARCQVRLLHPRINRKRCALAAP
jgi:hypothetical protein